MPGKLDNLAGGIAKGLPIGQAMRINYDQHKWDNDDRQRALDLAQANREFMLADVQTMDGYVDPGSVATDKATGVPLQKQGASEEKSPFDTAEDISRQLDAYVQPAIEAGDLTLYMKLKDNFLDKKATAFENYAIAAANDIQNGDYESAARNLQMAQSQRMDGVQLHYAIDSKTGMPTALGFDEKTGTPKYQMPITDKTADWIYDQLDRIAGPDRMLARRQLMAGVVSAEGAAEQSAAKGARAGEREDSEIEKIKSETLYNKAAARFQEAEAAAEQAGGGLTTKQGFDLTKDFTAALNKVLVENSSNEVYNPIKDHQTAIVGMVAQLPASLSVPSQIYDGAGYLAGIATAISDNESVNAGDINTLGVIPLEGGINALVMLDASGEPLFNDEGGLIYLDAWK